MGWTAKNVSDGIGVRLAFRALVADGGADAVLEVLEFSAMTRPELSENGSGRARETRLGRVDSRRPGAQDSVVRTPT